MIQPGNWRRARDAVWELEGTGACAGVLKGVGKELARSAGSEVAASKAICGNCREKTEFYAKQIGYQYRRFKAVDNTL